MNGLRPTRPAVPIAPYQGGKRFLANRIIERLGTTPHRTYVEPFTGLGGVFLRRPFRANAEVINDVSRDVANVFRVLQRHYQPLLDMLRWQVTSRTEFERLMATDPSTLTDLERAVRFIYLQRTTFGGKVVARSFGVSPANPARFDVSRIASILEAVHERIAGVIVECLPWAEILRRYDRPGTLFYCDPPYWGCERDYGDGVFGRDDFVALAEQLGRLKGSFLLSLNDVPSVRKIFAAFAIEAVTTTHSIRLEGSGSGTRELLISPKRKPA